MQKVEKKLIQFKELDDEGKGSAVFATFDVVDHDDDLTKRGAFGVQDIVIPSNSRLLFCATGQGEDARGRQ